MNKELLDFNITQSGDVTVFTNDTDMDVVISIIPVKPKRKYIDILVVFRGKHVIYDKGSIDLSQICFRFTTAL